MGLFLNRFEYENNKIPVFQAVRRSDNVLITWFFVSTIDYLLPARQTEYGFYSPIDYRDQWNANDYYSPVMIGNYTKREINRRWNKDIPVEPITIIQWLREYGKMIFSLLIGRKNTPISISDFPHPKDS